MDEQPKTHGHTGYILRIIVIKKMVVEVVVVVTVVRVCETGTQCLGRGGGGRGGGR